MEWVVELVFGLLATWIWLSFSASLAYIIVTSLGSLLRRAVGHPAPPPDRLRRATVLFVASAAVGQLFGGPFFIILIPVLFGWIALDSLEALIGGDLGEVPWLYVGALLTQIFVLGLYIHGTLGRWIDAARRRRLARREVQWSF